MDEQTLEWRTELPTNEGSYYVDEGDSNPRLVKIVNMKIDDNPERPDNFHVLEHEGDYYALSIENGCANWSWAKAMHLSD